MPSAVIAITGASGSRYAVRLIQILVDSGWDIFLTVTREGAINLDLECGVTPKQLAEEYGVNLGRPGVFAHTRSQKRPKVASLKDSKRKVFGFLLSSKAEISECKNASRTSTTVDGKLRRISVLPRTLTTIRPRGPRVICVVRRYLISMGLKRPKKSKPT